MGREPLEVFHVCRRIRWLTVFFMVGLVLSGVTAIPLEAEVDWIIGLGLIQQVFGAGGALQAPELVEWLARIQAALHDINARYPFIAYGGDWLAFGHLVVAIAFLGALRDPLRNRWLYSFGMIACALVVPYAFVFGAIRGIPIYWRLIDASFGVAGFIPLWLCSRWIQKLERDPASSALKFPA